MSRVALLAAALLGPAAALKGLSQASVHSHRGEPSNLTLTDIAIGMVSTRHMYMQPVHRAVLQYAPRGVFLQVPGDGDCLCRIRASFAALKKAYPKAKWYVVGNEDTFIHLDRLTSFLSQFDPQQPRVIGKDVPLPSSQYSIHYKCDIPSPWENTDMIWTSGATHIISNGLANLLDYNAKCEEWGKVLKSDSEHTCFIARSFKSPKIKFESLPHVTGTIQHETLVGYGEVQKSDTNEIRTSPTLLVANKLIPYELDQVKDVNKNSLPPHGMRMLAVANNHGCNAREADPMCDELCRLRAAAPPAP